MHQEPLNPKVPLNPFTHLSKGTKNLFATNLQPVIYATVLSIACSFGFSLWALKLLRSQINAAELNTSTAQISGHVFSELLLLALLGVLVSGFVSEILYRAVLTGVRRQKVSFSDLVTFIMHRYFTVILIFLSVIAILFVPFLVSIVLTGTVLAPLGVILSFVAVIFDIVFVFNMCYLLFVPIDDESVPSVGWAMKRSSTLWRKSRGAILLTILTFFVLAIIISILFGGTTHTQTSSINSGNNTINLTTSTTSDNGNVPVGSTIATSIIDGVLFVFVAAGLAEIYDQARLRVDGHTHGTYNTLHHGEKKKNS